MRFARDPPAKPPAIAGTAADTALQSRSAPPTPNDDVPRGVATKAPSNRTPGSVRRSASASRRLSKVTRPPSETPEQHQFAKAQFRRTHSAFPPAVVQQKCYPSHDHADRANLS